MVAWQCCVTIRLDDFKGLFQPKQIYDSVKSLYKVFQSAKFLHFFKCSCCAQAMMIHAAMLIECCYREGERGYDEQGKGATKALQSSPVP